MAVRTKLPLLLFFLSLFLLSASLTLGKGESQEEDPELQTCQHQCRHQEQFSRHEQQQCEQRCEKYHKEKQQQEKLRQCQQRCSQQEGRERQRCEQQCREEIQQGESRDGEQSERQDPERELRACKQECRQQHQHDQQLRPCVEQCQDRYEEQQKQHGGESSDDQEGEEEEQQQKEQDENPYVFRQKQHFSTKLQSKEGWLRVIQRFSKRSNLLQGIENYRLAVFQANPNTFTIPSHWDADSVCMVVNGKGVVTIIEENSKQTHDLQCGDIFRIRAGSSVYFVNKDNKEKLQIIEFINPVSVPGQFQAFFAAGGRDPESFFNTFSDDILQAAFNVPSTKIQKLFQGQRKGAFVKASREQIQALTRHSSSSEHTSWPIPPFRPRHEPKGTFNLFNQKPLHSNDFGALYQVDQDDFKQLQDLDVAVSFANITRGAMHGPYYNSRSTKIAIVVDGRGYMEMVCPHMSQEQRGRNGRHEQGQEQGQQYQKMSAQLSTGDVFVVPAGHPFVAVASRNENFQVACFEINAENNMKMSLVGKGSILRQLEREAKELSFDIPAKQVDEILEKQDQSWFLPGPHQRQEEQGRAYA